MSKSRSNNNGTMPVNDSSEDGSYKSQSIKARPRGHEHESMRDSATINDKIIVTNRMTDKEQKRSRHKRKVMKKIVKKVW